MEIREDCPSNDFKSGEPQGKCWGDGHYLCNECQYLRKDFKGDGWMKRDRMIEMQGQIQITTIK